MAERFQVSRPTIYDYSKSYSGRTRKQLPLLKRQPANQPREYLLVGIDDFSRELYAGIFPDKTQHSAARFLIETVIAQCPYQIDYAYSDNGREFKGIADHAFVKTCSQNGIWSEVYSYQSFANQRQRRMDHPCPNEHGHSQTCFKDSADRHIQLIRFISFYNTVKPHKSLNNATSYEILTTYFNQPLCKQP